MSDNHHPREGSLILSSARYHLFLDLDGVLADFEGGIKRVTGKYPDQLSPSAMWRSAYRAPDFFARLEWMSDGRELWEATRHLNPTVLTGLPQSGDWAARQKRAWCARELGEDVDVITCRAAEKSSEALQYIKVSSELADDAIPVIIDDRTRHRELWEQRGGVYIVHRSTERSLEQLRETLEGHRS